jgi:hypothetical protein
MTADPVVFERPVCRWCRSPLPERRPGQPRGGRRREFCSTSCRNQLHGRLRWLREELDLLGAWRTRWVEGGRRGDVRAAEFEERIRRAEAELERLTAERR